MVDELVGLCARQVEVRVDPALFRVSDIPRQEADIHKFTALTGWQPRIPWHTTLRDTFEYWRAKVREERFKQCAS
jgi:nucleoside-diphosphate-sugar epimerase